MISGFTAAIASALTVNQLDTGINSLNDMYNVRVATISGSSSEEFLEAKGFSYIGVKSIDDGLRRLSEERIDALVYDSPILKYKIKKLKLSEKIKVLPMILDPINYAFATPTNSKLREKVNRTLLKQIDTKNWKDKVNSYLGK